MDPLSAFLALAITYGGPKVVDAIIGVAVKEGWDFAQGKFARWWQSRREPTAEELGQVTPELVEAAREHIFTHPDSARAVTDAILAPPLHSGGSQEDILQGLELFLSGVFAGVGDRGLAALSGSLTNPEAVTIVDARVSRAMRMPPRMADGTLWFPPILQSLDMQLPRMWMTIPPPTPAAAHDVVAALTERFDARDLLGNDKSPAPIHLDAALIAKAARFSDPRGVAKVGAISAREVIVGMETAPAPTSGEQTAGLRLRAERDELDALRLEHAKAGVTPDSLRLNPDGIRSLGVAVRGLVAERQLRFDADDSHNRAVATALRDVT